MIKSRRLKWAGLVARIEKGRNALKILKGKPTVKRLRGRLKRKLENNIRLGLKTRMGIIEGSLKNKLNMWLTAPKGAPPVN